MEAVMAPASLPLSFLMPFLLFFMGGEPPADATPAAPLAIHAAAPVDTWSMLTFDRARIRADIDTLLVQADTAVVPREDRALPSAIVRGMLNSAYEAIEREEGGLPPGLLDKGIAPVGRVHVLLHGVAGMMRPGVAVVLEGADDATWTLLEQAVARLRVPVPQPDGNFEIGAPALRAFTVDGRELVTIQLPGQSVTVGRLRDPKVLVLAFAPRMVVRLLDGLTNPEAVRPSLADRFADFGLAATPPDATLDYYLNLPALMPMMNSLDGIPARQMNDSPYAGAAFSRADMLFDLSSLGPLTVTSQGSLLTGRIALPAGSAWRRWLADGKFAHASVRPGADGRVPLMAFSLGLADAPGLARAFAERWAWVATGFPEVPPPVAPASTFHGMHQVVEGAPAALGEPLSSFIGRLREVGVRIDLPPLAVDAALPQGAPMAMLVALNTSMDLRFRPDEDPIAEWNRLRDAPLLAGLLSAPSEPDADGVRTMRVSFPPGLGIPLDVSVAAAGARWGVSMDPARARALATAPDAAEDADGSAARFIMNGATLWRYARAMDPMLQAMVAVETTDAALAAPVADTLALDVTGVRFEGRGPLPGWTRMASVGAGALLPAIQRAREQAKSVNSMSNLKQWSIAFQLYCADHDGKMPADIRALFPYLGMPENQPADAPAHPLMTCPRTGQPYEYVKEWAGVPLAAAKNPSRMVMMSTAMFGENGQLYRLAAFADGHVARTAEDEFQTLLRETRAALAGRAVPGDAPEAEHF